MFNTIHSSLFSFRMRCLLFTLLSLLLISVESTAQTSDLPVFDGKLSRGLDLGVDSSEQRRDWVSKGEGYMKVAYPSGQDWGAVFITVGKPKDPPRPSRDLSPFKFLVMELKGESGGEQTEIGIKTNRQPDDGSEIKIPVKLTRSWQVFKFPLAKFEVDLRNLYVVSEFVFTGGTPQTIYFRNISYVAGEDGPVSAGDSRGVSDASASQTPETGNSRAPGSTENSNHAGLVPANARETFAFNAQTFSLIASSILGPSVLLVLILAFMSRGRQLDPYQEEILDLLMALTPALLAVFFVGGILLNATFKGFAISGTGGFVLFVVIFFKDRFRNPRIKH